MAYPDLSKTFYNRRCRSHYPGVGIGLNFPVSKPNFTSINTTGMWVCPQMTTAPTILGVAVATTYSDDSGVGLIIYAIAGWGFYNNNFCIFVDNGTGDPTNGFNTATVKTLVTPYVVGKWYYVEFYLLASTDVVTAPYIKLTVWDPTSNIVSTKFATSSNNSNGGTNSFADGIGQFGTNIFPDVYVSGVKILTQFSTNIVLEASQLAPVDLNNVVYYFPMDIINGSSTSFACDPANPAQQIIPSLFTNLLQTVASVPPVPEYKVPRNLRYISSGAAPYTPPVVSPRHVVGRKGPPAFPRVKRSTKGMVPPRNRVKRITKS